jgi:hypothetical protein
MPASVQLVTGLGGAIGCDYRPSRNQLVFVEFAGRLSRLNLLRALDTTVFSGTATMPADSSLDLTNGTSAQGGHIRWDHTSPGGGLVMRPQGNCRLAYLGAVSYSAVTHATVQGLSYSQDSLNGAAGPGNQLVNGAVFAVRNDVVQPAANFDYAKVQVLTYGTNIQVQWTTYRLRPRYEVLGTGYNQPEDVKVSADERHAYVTERVGNLLRVDLNSANRAAATVVTPGLNAPHQIALDEPHNQAYVVEFANPGRLLRIDLTSGAPTTLVGNLEQAIGLLVTADLQFAYVAEQPAAGGRVRRIQLSTGIPQTLVTGLTAPFFMSWADATESAIFIAERDPANRVTRLNLTQNPVTASPVASVPVRPSSVAVTGPAQLLVCSDQEITEQDLSAYVATGPIMLGVGHVPVDRISRNTPATPMVADREGYADTTVDPGYFFQVKDAPFGGTLSLMINHERAYADGARYYKLLVDGAELLPRQSWVDYLWSTPLSSFTAQTIAASATGYYRVRPPSELWYNHWLGYRLDTSVLTTGRHLLSVRLFASQSLASEIGSAANPGRSMVVRIDNQWPSAFIDQINHDGGPVATCAIVDAGSDAFTFQITALDAEQHLLSWALSAVWGDNKSKSVDGDSYGNHLSPTKKWAGFSGLAPVVSPSPWHAAVAGDPTSTHCAHTFYLGVWDRVIDGYGHIHYLDYHKSITIMLP